MAKFIEKFQHVKIHQVDSADDFYELGDFFGEYNNEEFGPSRDIQEVRAEIAQYMKGPDDPHARQMIGWDG